MAGVAEEETMGQVRLNTGWAMIAAVCLAGFAGGRQAVAERI